MESDDGGPVDLHKPDSGRSIPDVVSACRSDDVSLHNDSRVHSALSDRDEDDVTSADGRDAVVEDEDSADDVDDVLAMEISSGLVQVVEPTRNFVEKSRDDDSELSDATLSDDDVCWADVNRVLDDLQVPPAPPSPKEAPHGKGMQLKRSSDVKAEEEVTVHPVKSHSMDFSASKNKLVAPPAAPSKSESQTASTRRGPPKVRDDLGAGFDIKSLDDRKFKLASDANDVDFFADMMPTLTPAQPTRDVSVLGILSQASSPSAAKSSLSFAVESSEAQEDGVSTARITLQYSKFEVNVLFLYLSRLMVDGKRKILIGEVKL